MSGVGGEHADWECWSEGSGSSPVGIEQKENLLKIQSMKKQGKICKCLVGKIRED